MTSAPPPLAPTHNYKGKLRNKIFFLMVLIGVVPLLVAAGLTAYVINGAHRDDVSKLESVVLSQTAAQVQGFIDGSVLAQTKVVVPFGPGIDVATSAQQYVLAETVSARPFLLSESFINLEGHETTRVDQNQLQGYPASALRDLSASSAFQTAKSGAYYVSAVSYASGTPEIIFASPVLNNSNEVIAVVSGIVSLSPLQDIVSSAKIGDTGYLFLVDKDGALIAGGSTLANKLGSDVVSHLDIVHKVIGGTNVLSAADQMRYNAVSGKNVVAGAQAISQHGEPWGLIAEWPTAEADAVINALEVRDIAILIVVLALIILVSIFLASLIVRPVKKLEAGTARVAEGKFNEGVDITTGDELEELGDSFNTMVLGLKQLEALKDEFVFIAAHELRTPVAAMKGYLTLILEGTTGPIPDASKVFIQKVLASNQRLIQLVNDLLEVARSQAGRLTIQVAPIDLAPPIASTLDELKSLADEKSVTMAYQPPAGMPQVLADADRVKEVVINLVGNAIKYMGGPGTITITHEIVDTNLLTHIADSGLGISPEAQARLFEKFYRVQTDKTKEITGTGLGLFIVKEIIEKMNGTISVASAEGKGSVFTFSLSIK